jgi:hypothetical protein
MGEPQPETAVAKAREEAKRIRRSIGHVWQSVLAKLAKELQQRDAALPESLVKNLKTASDQLRLDYRLDMPEPPAEEPPAEPARDPLDGLRLVG